MKTKKSFKLQLRNNEVGIISLVVAILALFLNTWFYEKSEKNRNIRIASFEILMHLGEFQQVVNTIYYDKNSSLDLTMRGWGHLTLIGDLCKLLPSPLPEVSENLIKAWKENLGKLKESEKSANAISDKIDATRQAVVKIIDHLN